MYIFSETGSENEFLRNGDPGWQEKTYKKIVADILENIKTLQLSPSVLEELVQKE